MLPTLPPEEIAIYRVLVTKTAERHFDKSLRQCNWGAVSNGFGISLIDCLTLFSASASSIKPRSLIRANGGWSQADVQALQQFLAAYNAVCSVIDWKLVGIFMNVDYSECQRVGLGTYSDMMNASEYH
ncbi:hypothetical protein GGI21_005518, partial [Coemansia aciculifera]